MQQDKVLTMIGLAKRAGRISSGAPQCEKVIKSGKSELIIIAGDISENGRKAITDCCTYYKVNYIEYSVMYALSDAIGAEGVRTVISVNDKSFADAVLKKYNDVQS